jgi:hypothetical protein
MKITPYFLTIFKLLYGLLNGNIAAEEDNINLLLLSKLLCTLAPNTTTVF